MRFSNTAEQPSADPDPTRAIEALARGKRTIVELARGKPASVSCAHGSYHSSDAHANDGALATNFDSCGCCIHTCDGGNPWWMVDLEVVATITSVQVWPRTDCCAIDEQQSVAMEVWVGDSSGGPAANTRYSNPTNVGSPGTRIAVQDGARGRYVFLRRGHSAGSAMVLCEVKVFGQVGTNAPTTTAPATPRPTTATPTTAPITATPSARPSVSPTRHACSDGSHGCDTEHGICEQVDAGAGFRCGCAPTHHCSDGDCSTARHTCAWNTAAPSGSPTASSPTASPTVSPTVSPPTASPTVSPTTPTPTAAPTTPPTELYARDRYGNPIFPTDAAGNEVLATNERGHPVPPVDAWGYPVFPSTTAATSEIVPGDGANGSAGSSAGDNEGSSGGAIIGVAAGTVVILSIVVVGAYMYVKTAQRNGGGGDGERHFSNPIYAASPPPAAAATAQETSGYMDVPMSANPTYASAGPHAGTTGYMDVGPEDEDAEDV